MKKTLAMLVALVLLLGCFGSASALNYKGNLGNESTFETMTELRENAPEAMKAFNSRSSYIPHPALEGFNNDATYVYRSANRYGYTNAIRNNSILAVFTDEVFESKDAALTYLKDLGLVDIIEECLGSIVLVTPQNPAAGFGATDQKYYYALQTAMFTLSGYARTADGKMGSFVDGTYYGGFAFYYVMGFNGGATFLNNYVAGTIDYVGRIGGMLLVGGKMDRVRDVAMYVPAYLVNAPAAVVEKYKAANGVDAIYAEGEKIKYYNQQFPLRQVIVKEEAEVDYAALVHDAYYTMFSKVQRGEELAAGLNSASTAYQGNGGDCAPYSLDPRNSIMNGKTVDGIYEIEHVEDRFADIKGTNGEYLQTWYEYIPEEVINGTAKDGTIPMIVTIHGGGDDPRQYVDGEGYLELAGKERLILVSPEKGSLHVNAENGKSVLSQVIPALVRYMEETWPAIDASRVYVTGYSMGCLASLEAIYGDPSVFAAAYPQAGIAGSYPTEEQIANYQQWELPCVISTSEYDSPKNIENTEHIVDEFYNLLSCICVMNNMDPLPEADYVTYEKSGFKGDIYTRTTINGEYVKHSWYMTNDDGVPMVGLTFTDSIQHALYPEYADMVWDFCKHYSRNQETGEIVYNPYVR